MNAVEKLEAAIAQLEALRVVTSQGPWRLIPGGNGGVTLGGSESRYHPLIVPGDYAASAEEFDNAMDAELIVTLHRTIDAQLAILRADVEFIEEQSGPLFEFEPSTAALALADAILGGGPNE